MTTERRLLEQARNWIDEATTYTESPVWSPSISTEGRYLAAEIDSHLSKAPPMNEDDAAFAQPPSDAITCSMQIMALRQLLEQARDALDDRGEAERVVAAIDAHLGIKPMKAERKTLAEKSFINELGNSIRIVVEGPTSTHENIVTPMEANKLRDVLVAALSAQPPHGWRLAPEEPTSAMLSAMAECDGYAPDSRERPGLARWEDYWRVALAAAPQAKAQPITELMSELAAAPPLPEPRMNVRLDPFWQGWSIEQMRERDAMWQARIAAISKAAEPTGDKT